MARLIDADFAQHIANVELLPDTAGTVQWVLSHTPTVDAMEVVRCKDCKRCYKHTTKCNRQKMWICMRNDLDVCVRPDDFCSYGERKDDD